MRLTRTLPVLAVALIAGCTTTEQADKAMASKFEGQSADSFFLQYGPPSSFHTLDDGRRMYVWAERGRSVDLPSTTTSTVNVIGNTAFVSSQTSPGGSIEVQCQVRLLVDESGKIVQILSHSDSLGMWQLSRCNEIFG